MKKSELREIVKQTILENNPQRAPQRQAPDREVIEKPDTAPEKPTRRRTLTPPIESPTTRPKAEGIEKNIVNKISSRFSKLSKDNINENSTRDKAITIILKHNPDMSQQALENMTDPELARLVQDAIRSR